MFQNKMERGGTHHSYILFHCAARVRGVQWGEKADNHLTKKNIGPSPPRLAPISKVPGDALLLGGSAALCFGPHPTEWVGIRVVVRSLHISSLVSLHAMCVLLSAQGFLWPYKGRFLNKGLIHATFYALNRLCDHFFPVSVDDREQWIEREVALTEF